VTASTGGPAGDANQEIVGALVIVIQHEIGIFEIFGIEFQASHPDRQATFELDTRRKFSYVRIAETNGTFCWRQAYHLPRYFGKITQWHHAVRR
jgi:hypothetical protein